MGKRGCSGNRRFLKHVHGRDTQAEHKQKMSDPTTERRGGHRLESRRRLERQRRKPDNVSGAQSSLGANLESTGLGIQGLQTTFLHT